jgi:hypothetical protein
VWIVLLFAVASRAFAVVIYHNTKVGFVPEAEVNLGIMNVSYRESRHSESSHQGRESALSRHLRINVTAPVRAAFFE